MKTLSFPDETMEKIVNGEKCAFRTKYSKLSPYPFHVGDLLGLHYKDMEYIMEITKAKVQYFWQIREDEAKEEGFADVKSICDTLLKKVKTGNKTDIPTIRYSFDLWKKIKDEEEIPFSNFK